jgi:hypothetical protein
MPFLCSSCNLQTDSKKNTPCKPGCELFSPKETVLIHWAVRKNSKYVIACLENTAKPMQFLPLTTHISAATCQRCKKVAAELLAKKSAPIPSPPETLEADWSKETYNTLGYPEELIFLLQKHGFSEVKALREWIVSGNDVSTISADYADIILASLALGKE